MLAHRNAKIVSELKYDVEEPVIIIFKNAQITVIDSALYRVHH